MAAVKALRPRVSYADLERAPEDGHRYELYDGEVFVVPAPNLRHQITAQAILQVFEDFAASQGGLVIIAPMDVIFSDYDVVQPDVLFVQASRAHLMSLTDRVRHPPDIVVEVLSRRTAATDRGKKMQMFVRYGVPEYWIADPDARSIEVHGLRGEAYELRQLAEADAVVHSIGLSNLSFPATRAFPF